MNTTIYHMNHFGRLGKSIRLNLRAVRDLLGREVPHFDDLTSADKQLLQRRFTKYCKHGCPDFGIGQAKAIGSKEHPPSVDHLPNKTALRLALLVKGGAK